MTGQKIGQIETSKSRPFQGSCSIQKYEAVFRKNKYKVNKNKSVD